MSKSDGSFEPIQSQPLGEPLRSLGPRIGERDLARPGFRAGSGDRGADSAGADNEDALSDDAAACARDPANKTFAVE
jgi:hypothetical protein